MFVAAGHFCPQKNLEQSHLNFKPTFSVLLWGRGAFEKAAAAAAAAATQKTATGNRALGAVKLWHRFKHLLGPRY
jgi:hypothetical protein